MAMRKTKVKVNHKKKHAEVTSYDFFNKKYLDDYHKTLLIINK